MPYALEKPFICGVPNAGRFWCSKKSIKQKIPIWVKNLKLPSYHDWIGPPPQDDSGKWRFRLGLTEKNVMSSWWWLLLGGGLMQLNTAFLCNQCSPFLLSKTHSLRRSTSCGAMWRWHFKPQAHSETPTPSAIDQCPRNERGDLLCQ